MSQSYEEILEGESIVRSSPGARHEAICAFLHERIASSVKSVSTTKQLAPRSIVQLSPGTMLRPDLALVTIATNKVWLAAEIIDSSDHRTDTVVKKQFYEDANLPRLWMIDPRYDNVEIYFGTKHGLALQKILAGKEVVKENLLPSLEMVVAELFEAKGNSGLGR